MKVAICFLCAAALAAMAVVFGRGPSAADSKLFAFVVVVLSVIAAVLTWRATRRRERHKIEGMRDSALW